MTRRLPSLNGLVALEAALRHRSVRRAAVELRVTPAAVSQRIKHMEAALGVSLLVRHARGVSLTSAGERFLPQLARGLDALEELVHAASQSARSVSVVITTLPSLGRSWLLPLLPELRRRFPNVEFTLRTEATLVDFDQSEVTLGIRYCAVPEAGLVSLRLFGETVFPVCAPQLLHGKIPLRSLDDLGQHCLLHDADAARNGPPFAWADWLPSQANQSLRSPGVTFTDASLLLDAAEAGLGVALARSPIVRARLLAGRLVTPFAEQRGTGRSYFVVTSRRQYRKGVVRELFDWFAGQAADWTVLFDGRGVAQ